MSGAGSRRIGLVAHRDQLGVGLRVGGCEQRDFVTELTSASHRLATTRSVPPYSFGGMDSVSGAIWAMCMALRILRSSREDACVTLRAAEKFFFATSVVSEAQPIFARRHADLAREQLAKRGDVFVAALLDDALQRQSGALQKLPRAGDALRL